MQPHCTGYEHEILAPVCRGCRFAFSFGAWHAVDCLSCELVQAQICASRSRRNSNGALTGELAWLTFPILVQIAIGLKSKCLLNSDGKYQQPELQLVAGSLTADYKTMVLHGPLLYSLNLDCQRAGKWDLGEQHEDLTVHAHSFRRVKHRLVPWLSRLLSHAETGAAHLACLLKPHNTLLNVWHYVGMKDSCVRIRLRAFLRGTGLGLSALSIAVLLTLVQVFCSLLPSESKLFNTS